MSLYHNSRHNPALLTDLYQLTMMQGYFYNKNNLNVVFDMFFRREPFGGGYAVFAGLQTLVDIIANFNFCDDDIDYLASLGLFKKEFLEYLKNFRFNIDLYSVSEGDIVFPNEPLIRVHGNVMEVQLLETIMLNVINFQTLIATKSARITEAAKGRAVLEFGLRRAQGMDGAVSASRASFIGGAAATSNVLAGKLFGIPPKGTMAHSWVMAFDSELESFKKYAEIYPDSTIMLVDTYNTLESGVPQAIKVLTKLKKKGVKSFGIRLDSGDLDYLARETRSMLDKAGLKNAKIVVSNELDEYVIEELVNKGAPIDSFGVGTNLVTARGDSSLTGVFKLVAKKEDADFIPSIKISNDPKKTTNPGIKNIVRFYKNNQMLSDLIFMENEKDELFSLIKRKKEIIFCHPDYSYKHFKLANYDETKILLNKIIANGKLVTGLSSLTDIQKRCRENIGKLDLSYKRLLNPHIYKVSLTQDLMLLKIGLINKYNNSI